MANVNFNLRKQAATTPQPLYMVIRWQGKRLVYPTLLKVLPKHWDREKQCVRAVIAVPEKDIINGFIKDLAKEALRLYAAAIAARKGVTPDIIKKGLDSYTNRHNEARTLTAFIDKYIDDSPRRVNPQTGKLISPRTIQKYKTTQSLLNEYTKATGRPVDFENIDLAFYEAFTAYMVNVKKYQTNTIGKHISILKDWLNEATRKGLNAKLEYKAKAFKAPNIEAFAVYLTERELMNIYGLDLAQNKRLDRVRDLFIIGAFTGLRYSDFTAIRPEHIRAGNIELYQQKTGAKVVIPIHHTVKAILAKHGNKAPAPISQQKTNDYIKEVCRLAGINEQTEKREIRAGLETIKLLEKWELVSTHTARRSFATNAYLAKVPAQTIMKITGHSTEKAFMKYLKLNGSEHAAIMQNIWQLNPVLAAVK